MQRTAAQNQSEVFRKEEEEDI